MKKLFKLRLIILLAIFALNSCSKDDYQGIKEEKKLMVLSKNKIENVEIENNIIKTLSKIKQVFEINAPKSYKRNVSNRSANDSINLNEITINTEAYNTIEDENGKISYIFDVKYPTENIENKEIINLHYFYDENNILKNQLIKYDLTQSDLETIKINNSYDGFLDNISYIDLSRGCPCQGGGTPNPVWVPYPNYSGYGGSSPSVPYILPPLSTLPPSVTAALVAAGAIYSTNPSFIPGGNPSYTFPIQYFSVNDLTIPAQVSSNPAISFNSFNTYYFSNIKNIIKNYYENIYVPELNSYTTSSQTTLTDHIVKQKFIYDFFIYRYSLEQSNTPAFNYLASNPERIEAVFNFLQKNKVANGSISYNQKYLVNQILNYLVINPLMTWDILMKNRTDFDINQAEIDNYTIGNYDTSTYSEFNPQQQPWPNISAIIPQYKFEGWNRNLHPNWQCMDYSKEQLKVMGYQISSYYSAGQTFQIYSSQNGVNTTKLAQGLSYLKYALSNNIPIIVGIDDAPGHPGNLDNTTDHFVVIVGMGTDSNGKYFQFYDNATGNLNNGTSSLNKLYYNSTTGIISGTSQASPYSTGLTYILTMIRKSKTL